VGEEGNGATQSAPFVKGVELELFILLNGLSTQGGVLHYCSPIMGIKHERFENSGRVLGQHPGLFSLDCKGCLGGRRKPTPYTCCHQDTFLVAS